jgi:hypothetical protein
MSILVNKNTRVLTQGITGATGQFHTKACKEYGTQMVAGVTPGKGGTAVCATAKVMVPNIKAEKIKWTKDGSSMYEQDKGAVVKTNLKTGEQKIILLNKPC